MKAAWALVALGLLQMAADVSGLPSLRGLAAATSASPAPKVFSSLRGLETYSSRFLLEWEEGGETHSRPLTPELYAGLEGPYPRRNAYGAAIAYGPVLASQEATRALHEAVAHYALCGERRLLRELGIGPGGEMENLRIRWEPREGSELGELPQILQAPCGE